MAGRTDPIQPATVGRGLITRQPDLKNPDRMADTATRTFLFTDIEGSTRRWEHQRTAMTNALARHDALLRAVIEGHGGRASR